ALGPVMLRLAGEQAAGTILWMADERAVAEHVVPRITKAAAEAGRPAPRVVAGIPVVICPNDEVDEARAWANQVLGQAEISPNYQRLLARGDATTMGDILAAGDESAVVRRLRAFRDAGATDLAVRVLPVGPHREARIESRKRTLAFLASLCPELRTRLGTRPVNGRSRRRPRGTGGSPGSARCSPATPRWRSGASPA